MSEPAYFAPRTLDEALALLAAHEDAVVVAGGVNVVLVRKWVAPAAGCFVYVGGVPGLERIVADRSTLRIGALARHADLARSPVIGRYVPILAHAAAQVGSPQIRNQGTIGGNLVWASPDADLVPPLLALDGTVVLQSVDGHRTVPIRDFFLGAGTTAIRTNELLTEVRIDTRPHHGAFLKFTRRKGPSAAVASTAVVLRSNGRGRRCAEAAIAIGASVVNPVRVPAAEALLHGADLAPSTLSPLVRRAGQIAAAQCDPRSDARGPAWYRRRVTAVLVERAILQAAEIAAATAGASDE